MLTKPEFWSEEKTAPYGLANLNFTEAATVGIYIRALQAYIEQTEKRLPPCPPCDMGENTPCICHETLIPLAWLNEVIAERDKAHDEIVQMLKAVGRGAKAIIPFGAWDAFWNAYEAQPPAADGGKG